MTLEGGSACPSTWPHGHTAQLLSGPSGSGMLQRPDALTLDQALCPWDEEDRPSRQLVGPG